MREVQSTLLSVRYLMRSSTVATKTSYSTCQYSDQHWAVDYTKAGTCIAVITYKEKQKYSVLIHPNDRRGYRTLVTFIGYDNTPVQSAFNRPYTVAEQRGLTDVETLMFEIYKSLGLSIVQSAELGNNAHSYDAEAKEITIGEKDEPSMLHLHIWGRGNPKQEYISGVPLEGPAPGEMMDLVAKHSSNPSTHKFVAWEEKQLETSLQTFKKSLLIYTSSTEFQEEFGSTLKIAIHQPEKLLVDEPVVSPRLFGKF